jgi:hypothetical protein
MTTMIRTTAGPSPGRRLNAVGLAAALFVTVGGMIATIAGNGFAETVGEPSEIGGFGGAIDQIGGLLLAVCAGTLAAMHGRERHERR